MKPGLKSPYTPYYEQEAWIWIFYACISADGLVYDSEIDTLTKIFVYKSFFDDFDFLDIYNKADELQKEIGNKSLIDNAIPAISETNKKTVYVTALNLVYADGIMRPEEKEIIDYLAQALNLKASDVNNINEVISDLNKYKKELTEDFIETESY